jgi:hypothetical protein
LQIVWRHQLVAKQNKESICNGQVSPNRALIYSLIFVHSTDHRSSFSVLSLLRFHGSDTNPTLVTITPNSIGLWFPTRIISDSQNSPKKETDNFGILFVTLCMRKKDS